MLHSRNKKCPFVAHDVPWDDDLSVLVYAIVGPLFMHHSLVYVCIPALVHPSKH